MPRTSIEDAVARPAGLAETIARVRAEISNACQGAQRDPVSVTLVAASKLVVADLLVQALGAGHRIYGENRVQEARQKWPALKARYPDVELHLLGGLQTNKARDAVLLFDVIHSLDREPLAAALARQSAQHGRRPRVFVQVNTGGEPQKSGTPVPDADRLIAVAREQHGLDVVGLMCVPPAGAPPEAHFTLLAEIAARNALSSLSMGMSGDYALAIEYGATHVRVGTGIFGGRPAQRARELPKR